MAVSIKETREDRIRNTLRSFKKITSSKDKENISVSTEMLITIGKDLYRLLEEQYNETKSAKEQKYICDIIISTILEPLQNIVLYQNKEHKKQEIAKVYNLYMAFFKMSCRRNIRNFAFFYESTRHKKVFSKTEETFAGTFAYTDEFLSDESIEVFRLSCMPGLGKSFVANLVVAMYFGNNPNGHALRITYSDDLVQITTRQTKAIIESQAFKEVFPRYLNVDKMFKKDDSYSFTMIDSEDEYSFYGVTRDGQATGKRSNLIVIDDLLKGESEANNISLQKKLVDRYDSDWTSRTDDDNLKVFMVGTMWSPTDLLNVVYERALEFEDIVPDVHYKYVQKSVDGKNIYISIPALNDKDQSTAPKRFSTEKLLKKRMQMDDYLWSAVYMQRPIAPTGLEFAYEKLKIYEKLIPIQESHNYLRKASLDPARRGKNYVSMPIIYEKGSNAHYIVDWLFRKEPMSKLYLPICDMLIKYRIQRLVLENNTDTSLKTVLEEILKGKGYMSIEIIEKYSTQNKEQRIKDHRGSIISNYFFPKKGLFPKKHEVTQAMEDLTSYSFDYPNKYDDAIDSVVIYDMEFVNNSLGFASVRSFSRKGIKL